MNPLQTKQTIAAALASFATSALAPAASSLFESLGYRSQKRLALTPNTPDNFLATFAQGRKLNPDHALVADWESVDFLFQLADEEVRAAAGGNQQFLFDSKGKYNGAAMESYLFFAIALKKPHYTRTELSGITRAVNRLFPMPVMLRFRHGDTLTLAVINRRLHKREESKDVLEKVTLIKDIRFACPHRAHVEILFDLSFDALREAHDFTNFVALHAAWQKTLDSSELNKRFFQEVANWYFWAVIFAEMSRTADDPELRALKRRQQSDRCGNHVAAFIQEAMKPVRHTGSPGRFDTRRDDLNKVLAFAGYELGEDGFLKSRAAARTLPEAEQRANRLRAALRRREVHGDVLRFCRAELLQDNYFHALLEATKSLSEKIRTRTGLAGDGGPLADQALGLGQAGMPFLAFNSLRTESEQMEQRGLLNLLKGLFGTFRNPTAHAPKVSWNMTEQDALDLLTMASFLDRRLDSAARTPRTT